MEQKRKKKILLLAVHAGEIMMKNGAEISRVEDTLNRVLNVLEENFLRAAGGGKGE